MALNTILRTLLGGDAIFGAAPIREQIGSLNPQQEEVLSQLGSVLEGQLGQEQSSPFEFGARREAALRQFEKGLPSIGERFQAIQGDSLMGSAAEQAATYGARADLESQLLGQEEGLRSQNFFNLLNSFMSPQYQTFETPQPGLLSALLGLGGSVAGGYFGGETGAGLGGKAGMDIGSIIGRAYGTPQTAQPRI